MIHPNMATMLAFLPPTRRFPPKCCIAPCKEAVDVSFNMVSVDGDTSTNDMFAILASGLGRKPEITGKMRITTPLPGLVTRLHQLAR